MKLKWIGAVGLLSWLAVAMLAVAETKYASGTTSAALTFSARSEGRVVESLYATTDKENGAVKFYRRTGNRIAPSASATNAAVLISVPNTGYVLTTNDLVVYQHVNGTADYRTVSAASPTTVTLSSGITVAGATGDAIYELTQGGQIVVGADGSITGKCSSVATSGVVFETGGDSPLYCVLDGTGATVLQVTCK